MRFPPLFRRRAVPLPTAVGWLVLMVAAVLVARLAAPGVYRFLACGPSKEPGRYLVVEGWIPDHAVSNAVAMVRAGRFERVFTTGGPIEQGTLLTPWKDWAGYGAAVLVAAGAPSNAVTAVPAAEVRKDRTYASALALRDHCRAAGIGPAAVTLMTSAPHARRSRMLFRRALRPPWEVRIEPYEPADFSASDWWRSSEGFKTVLTELFAYAYARTTAWRLRD